MIDHWALGESWWIESKEQDNNWVPIPGSTNL
jgi:hypothetical protein